MAARTEEARYTLNRSWVSLGGWCRSGARTLVRGCLRGLQKLFSFLVVKTPKGSGKVVVSGVAETQKSSRQCGTTRQDRVGVRRGQYYLVLCTGSPHVAVRVSPVAARDSTKQFVDLFSVGRTLF